MSNIKEWLIDVEQRTGETIEAIVVGLHYCDSWDDENDRRPEHQRDVVLTREDGLTLLDEEYDSSLGGADCHPMYAWSASFVYFIHEYDGSTSLVSVPRNPIDCRIMFSAC